MPIEFPFLDDVLRERGIAPPAFDILSADARQFRMLLFQPRAELVATQNSISCTDQPFLDRFRGFFSVARSSNADLALTPEYSSPWSVLIDVLRNGITPAAGKLWVIGSQSITVGELRALAGQLPNVKVVYDPALETASVGTYVDPACLIFAEAAPSTGVVMVIQAKCAHMSVYPDVENIVHGNRVYVVRNDANSIYLATIICSDALAVPIQQLPQIAHQPYILLHPQLNPDARYQRFAQYRFDLFGTAQDDKEVICLNWAEGTEIRSAGHTPIAIKSPHSAIYSKWPLLALDDTRLTANHSNGLYYCNWHCVRTAAYVLNYDELCFEIVSSKPSGGFAAAATVARRGPVCEKVYSWQGAVWTPGARPDDFRLPNLAKYTLTYPFLGALSPLFLERFVCLSSGDVEGCDWHSPKKLRSMMICRDEIVSRATYDRDARSVLSPQRLERTRTLFSLFQNATLLNERTGGKLASTVISYDPNEREMNVYRRDGSFGTSAFVGACSDPADVEGKARAIRSVFGVAKFRLFVWYQEGIEFKCLAETTLPDITYPNEDSRDIAAEMGAR